jgi:hypothetical protein
MVIVAILYLFIFAQAEDDGPEELRVKGIYMGMNMDEAKKIFRKLIDKTMTLEEDNGTKPNEFCTSACAY